VAVGFRRVVIDWPEGRRWAEARAAKAAEVGYRGVLLEAERALRDESVLVSVADAAGPGAAWVRFYMTADAGLLELHYEPPGALEACRELARKLAEVLGYEFATDEDSPAEERLPSDILVHRDLLPDAEGRLPTAKGCLPTEELLRRVANRFPLAVIDRERGDRTVRAGADNLAALKGSPTDPSVERHLALVGPVAHVTIRDAVGGPQFGFFLIPNPTVIHIEYERPQDREACRPLLEALVAELADYYHTTQDLDIESENLDD
jgi:hypothetical protein